MNSKGTAPIFLLLLAILCSTCSLAPATATQHASPALPATRAELTSNAALQPSLTQTRTPSQTPEPAIPTSTYTPSPELLTCPVPEEPQANPTQPLEILYTNNDQVWLWDEASQENTQVKLPPEAVAPHISMDGRFAAYLIRGRSYDSPENPQDEIPLWMFDLQSGQTRQVGSFPVSEMRQQYPESPYIYLRLRWLESNPWLLDDHWLLAEVFWEPWAETGCCVPRGDLYLVKAETGEYKRILRAGGYFFFSVRPDGRQIAALDMEGQLFIIDVPPGGQMQTLKVRLPENPWLVFAPQYSPDGTHMALQVEHGLALIDANSGGLQELALENPCQDCYWGPRLPVIWLPDGSGFYTTTSLNDDFDQQAETTLIWVNLGQELEPEIKAVIHANPFTSLFSPDLRYLSYWNQPDWDTIEAGEGQMNLVSLYLMDLREPQVACYAEQFGLRLSSWSPDNQYFLYTYSSVGGANLDRKMLSLGNICQPPKGLPVPKGAIIDETRWLDAGRFLAWTQPADGVPDLFESGMYLYRLGTGGLLLHIDDILIDQSEPYGTLKQAVVLRQ